MVVVLVMTMLGRVSLLSPAYRWMPKQICFRLLRQTVRCALDFAFDRTGSNKAARMAMTAITTRSSISVNARNFDFTVLMTSQ